MRSRGGRILEQASPANGWRARLEPEPELREGETVHFDHETLRYTVVPEDALWPDVTDERIEEWWQLSRGVADPFGLDLEAKKARNALEEARRQGATSNFTSREMRMLEEIERLRKILDPSRERPGWGSRAWKPRPGEVGADGTRY
jgi:hypothetical protein